MSDHEEFPELEALQRLIARGAPALRFEVVGGARARGASLPIYSLELGAKSADVPAVGFFAGVHGVERIGTQVLIAFLHSLIERLHWDETLQHVLDKVRLVFMPIVNPGGMQLRTRANPDGIDLMRNAPIDAERGAPWLLRGQRLTGALPWYRGPLGAPMQHEAAALCDVVRRRVLSQRFALTIDCHSGFGTRDRIWFPYARTRQPIGCLPEIYALRTLFRTTHPYHGIYVIEPQSRQYMTHGDLWDYLYDSAVQPGACYIPLTLELGSWLWVKKSPGQLFNLLGMYNPMVPHRLHRALRRHLTLLDFLIRAAVSHRRWRPADDARLALREAALAYWYRSPLVARDRIA